MKRAFINIGVFLGTAALGLLLSVWILEDFRLSAPGFITAVVVFAIAQSVLAPLIRSIAEKYASALLGGIGLFSTLAALLVASLFPGGLDISGIGTWILGALIVWLITALGTWIVPLLLFRDHNSNEKSSASHN